MSQAQEGGCQVAVRASPPPISPPGAWERARRTEGPGRGVAALLGPAWSTPGNSPRASLPVARAPSRSGRRRGPSPLSNTPQSRGIGSVWQALGTRCLGARWLWCRSSGSRYDRSGSLLVPRGRPRAGCQTQPPGHPPFLTRRSPFPCAGLMAVTPLCAGAGTSSDGSR